MQLVDFTSYDDIRAALGVAKAELEDTTLSLVLYANNLASEFDQVDPTLVDVYTALPAVNAQTAAEKSFARYVNLFATYAVARQLTISLPLFSPKEIGDGKATMTRYALDPYKQTVLGVLGQYDTFRALLITAFKALGTGSTAVAVPTRPYFMGVASGSDPVTGN